MDTIPFLHRKSCPICQSHEGQQLLFERGYLERPIGPDLAERYPALPMELLAGHTFAIMKCRTCTGLYHRDVIEDFYDNPKYKAWDNAQYTKKAARRTLYYQSFQNNFIAAVLVVLSAMRGQQIVPADLAILDYGCGAGEFLSFARAYGLEADGYDADPLKQVILAERGIGFMDDIAIANPKRTYDIINSNMVFEHLLHPLEVLSNLSRALAPGGLMRLSVPSSKNIEAKIHVDANWRTHVKGTADTTNPIWPFGHRNCFTPASIEIMAGQCGLRVLDPESLPGFTEQYAAFPFKPIIRLDGQFYLTNGE